MTDTATVETLTAEVRCLMVGSRQITLSVARQLDVIPLADLRVFGRVHLKDGAYVIGAAPDGSLATATYKPNDFVRPLRILNDELSAKITVCSFHSSSEHTIELKWGDQRLRIDRQATQPCDIEAHRYRTGRCEHWSSNDLDMEIGYMMAVHNATEQERVTLNDAAAAAPLIVLAGLR